MNINNFRSIAVLLSALSLIVSASCNKGKDDNPPFPSEASHVQVPMKERGSTTTIGGEIYLTPIETPRRASRYRPSVDITKKESNRDESIPLLEPSSMNQDDRFLVESNCNGDKGYFRLVLDTDHYGFETSWKLIVRKGNKWAKVKSGPGQGVNYGNNKRYIEAYCLSPGKYKFIIYDSFKDGMCCTHGEGGYTGFVDGSKKFSSQSDDSDWAKQSVRFTISPPPSSQPTKTPTRKPTQNPTNNPTGAPQQNNNDATCDQSTHRKVKIEILTDRYGEDTSWDVVRHDDNTNVAQSSKGYGRFEKDATEICLENGAAYDFTINDSYGDGMCCQFGDGHFKVYLDEDGLWDEIISGGIFKNQVAQVINLTEQSTNERDLEWLESHNTRRQEWHERYNETFVPLKWSNGLKKDSEAWAIELLNSCGKGMHHDNTTNYGENIAANFGTGSWARLMTTDAILTRFVEREVDMKPPSNGHLTQVLWRSTKYVGCVETSELNEDGKMCRVQVCRYARAGMFCQVPE
mmetsp:Transcript_29464/g.61481  ORF Transcript_29464/g.61481 Transcript_29464/m.61481 type:complete len:519 (+) Transcript_29464:86-1642(+)